MMMGHPGHSGWPAVLADGDIKLRPYRRRDAEAWSQVRMANEAWLTPWEPTGVGTWAELNSVAAYRIFHQDLRHSARDGTAMPFAIWLGRRYVGHISLGGIARRAFGSAYAGYWVDSAVAGRGVMPTALALVEGWVDHVTSRVTSQWMPNGSQLVEVIRRRRATGGPTQRVLTDLIGLELSPRLVRDAENLWAAVDHERGLDGRDAVWRHPDLMPTRDDLQDPLAFTQADQQEEQPEEDEMDRELRKLLESEGRD